MIITLKGCTATAFIGGLNFFKVSKGTVSGADVTISTSTINKDAATSTSAREIATVALKSNYENLVVTVTMGGTTVNWFANGKVTIPANTAVTGDIKISASATAVSGGEVVDPEEPGTGGETPDDENDANLMPLTARLNADTTFTTNNNSQTQWGAFRGATPVVENDYVKISCENQTNTLAGIRMGVPNSVSELENGTDVEISFYYKKDSSYEPVGEYKFYTTSAAKSFKFTNDWQQFKKTYTWDGTWDRLQISSATTMQTEAVFYVKDFCIKIK